MKLFRLAVILFVFILFQKIAFENWEFKLEFLNQIVLFIFISTLLFIFYYFISFKINNKKTLNILFGCLIFISIFKIFINPEKSKILSKKNINPTEEIIIIESDPSTYIGNSSSFTDTILIKKYFLVQKKSKINN